jgi:arylsulfatase A-like enzyme
MDRRRLLMTAGAVAPLLAAADGAAAEQDARRNAGQGNGKSSDGDDGGAGAAARRGPSRDFAGMNVVLFITDQQRAIQHFPKGWAKKHLPGYTRLKKHGVSFENAFCNACMCSPSRATLFTGYFPAQHGVKYTLEADMPAGPVYDQVELPTPDALPNLATALDAAGYALPYKGKWHCSKPANGITNPAQNPPCTPDEGFVPADLADYGFARWNPPDAGANQDVCQAGGGTVDNDGRIMNDDGDVAAGDEGVLAYLRSAAAQEQPFFLTVGLVNPHDVLAYPGVAGSFDAFGYDDTWLESTGIERPATAGEDLSTKPSVQEQFLNLTTPLRPRTAKQQKTYLNFYGNLMASSDDYLVQILDTLEDENLLDNTLVVYTSDHGEMGTAHGGMIQKNFNFYEETMRVPLVFSNPRLFPNGTTSKALVSHVDFLPTMASLLEIPESARQEWQGVDYSRVVKNPGANGPQNYVVFTFDDWQGGQSNPLFYPTGANRIVSIREGRYKLAKYYDPDGVAPDEFEMYDLKADPLEKRNLAFPGAKLSRSQRRAYNRLLDKLAEVEQTRLQPLA